MQTVLLNWDIISNDIILPNMEKWFWNQWNLQKTHFYVLVFHCLRINWRLMKSTYYLQLKQQNFVNYTHEIRYQLWLCKAKLWGWLL